jgi:hypothetical protein
LSRDRRRRSGVLEVADAPFAADPELRETPVGLARAGRVLARDQQPLWLGKMLADGAGLKAAVRRDQTGS